jgi:hypothetical protein
MDFEQVISNLNFPAIFVSALSSFVFGWLWYGPLFGKKWMVLNGFNREEMRKQKWLPFPLILGINYFSTVLAAFSLAMFLGAESDAVFGIFAGLMIAIFWIATSRLNDVLYERKPIGLFWINVGYNVVIYAIMGAIIGAWK